MRARMTLAQLYRERGDLAAADAQYRLVLQRADRLEWLEEARKRSGPLP